MMAKIWQKFIFSPIITNSYLYFFFLCIVSACSPHLLISPRNCNLVTFLLFVSRELFKFLVTWIYRGHRKLYYNLYLRVSSAYSYILLYCCYIWYYLRVYIYALLGCRTYGIQQFVGYSYSFETGQNPSTSSVHPRESARNIRQRSFLHRLFAERFSPTEESCWLTEASD